MKICFPKYYDEFKCVGGACVDTCCKFWQVELDAEFVERCETLDMSDEIRHRIKKNTTGFNTKRFRNCRNGNCPFLNNQYLCDLHSVIGNENLPNTCRLYPRFINNFGGYEERGLSFSCPVAAKLISEGNTSISISENDEPIGYTDVDGELFIAVRSARNRILDFIRCFKGEPQTLANSVLKYAKEVQKLIELGHYHEIASLIICESVENAELLTEKELKRTINHHLGNVFLQKSFKTELQKALVRPNKVLGDHFKIWFNYFIFRYLIVAASDFRFLRRIKAAILSYAVIASLDGDIVSNMQRYSKETEHNQKNMERLFEISDKTLL